MCLSKVNPDPDLFPGSRIIFLDPDPARLKAQINIYVGTVNASVVSIVLMYFT